MLVMVVAVLAINIFMAKPPIDSLLFALALAVGLTPELLALFPGGNALWVLPLLAGLGAAPILTLPIGYWQDLMTGRPGTAAALMALQRLAGDLLSVAIFAIGTAIGGYVTAAAIGGGLAIFGAFGLWLADRHQPPGAV